MFLQGIRRFAVKAIALLSIAVVTTGFMSAYVNPRDVSADDDLYDCLYDVFRDRSDDPDNFMTQERFAQRVLGNCALLNGIDIPMTFSCIIWAVTVL